VAEKDELALEKLQVGSFLGVLVLVLGWRGTCSGIQIPEWLLLLLLLLEPHTQDLHLSLAALLAALLVEAPVDAPVEALVDVAPLCRGTLRLAFVHAHIPETPLQLH
jgi:hypothetical protein